MVLRILSIALLFAFHYEGPLEKPFSDFSVNEKLFSYGQCEFLTNRIFVFALTTGKAQKQI